MGNEIDKIIEHSYEYAKDILTDTGELYPFGAYIGIEENVHPLEFEYDKKNHEFQVAMNFSGEVLGRLAFKFEGAEGDNTIWKPEVTIASLTERGNRLMEQGGVLYLDLPEKVKVTPDGLIKYAQYHKKTGKCYKPSAWWLLKVKFSSIWATLFR